MADLRKTTVRERAFDNLAVYRLLRTPGEPLSGGVFRPWSNQSTKNHQEQTVLHVTTSAVVGLRDP